MRCNVLAMWLRSSYRRELSMASAARRASSWASSRSSSPKMRPDSAEANVIADFAIRLDNHVRPDGDIFTEAHACSNDGGGMHTGRWSRRLKKTFGNLNEGEIRVGHANQGHAI